MLAVTDSAAAAIRELVAELPGDDAGLRIVLERPGNGTEPEFGLHVVPAPDDGDDVVECSGARIFLDPAASGFFQDKVLDAKGDVFTFAPA
jgi:iron-sulfur cluster assembly protein